MAEPLDLPEGWNSSTARRIDPAAVIWALDLLGKVMQPDTPAPTVIPTARGELELEWHLRGIDLEVHAVSPGRLYFYFEDQRSGPIEERETAPRRVKMWWLPLTRRSVHLYASSSRCNSDSETAFGRRAVRCRKSRRPVP